MALSLPLSQSSIFRVYEFTKSIPNSTGTCLQIDTITGVHDTLRYHLAPGLGGVHAQSTKILGRKHGSGVNMSSRFAVWNLSGWHQWYQQHQRPLIKTQQQMYIHCNGPKHIQIEASLQCPIRRKNPIAPLLVSWVDPAVATPSQ